MIWINYANFANWNSWATCFFSLPKPSFKYVHIGITV